MTKFLPLLPSWLSPSITLKVSFGSTSDIFFGRIRLIVLEPSLIWSKVISLDSIWSILSIKSEFPIMVTVSGSTKNLSKLTFFGISPTILSFIGTDLDFKIGT